MRMQLPPLKSLWYFKHAAELGSFKLAAEQLFVSQAAVSQQIRLLEQQLDCSLFTRHTRFVELTRQGEQLLPHVLKGFSHLQAGVQAVSQDNHPNTLNLTVLPSFASGWLLGRISDFQNKYPNIKVRIEPSDQLADFSAGQVDLGIRFGQGNSQVCTVSLSATTAYFWLINPVPLMLINPSNHRFWHKN